MNILKIAAMGGLSIAMTSCMVVPPTGTEMGGTASVYSTSGVPSQPPVIIQQPTQQPVIIQQPAQPVIIQQPEHTKQHCYDPHSGEYLKVPPHSNKCHEWLHNNQRARERHHLCIDRKTGHHVNGVPANSPECHRINNPQRHEPPRHPQPPSAPPAKQPPPQQQPIQQPATQPASSVCIDKRTGKAVDGVAGNSLQCTKINH